MGRKKRNCEHNLTRHVYSRCINKEDMMDENLYKDLMIQVLKETLELYTFELISFELLDNHFHFIIRTVESGETISKIMQRIKSVFARRLNKLLGRCGPVWNERFGDKIVEFTEDPVKYMLNLLWYIAYNSLRKKAPENPREYTYGSINHYLKKGYRGKLPITLAKEFIKLGKTFTERVQAFLGYEKCYLGYT